MHVHASIESLSVSKDVNLTLFFYLLYILQENWIFVDFNTVIDIIIKSHQLLCEVMSSSFHWWSQTKFVLEKDKYYKLVLHFIHSSTYLLSSGDLHFGISTDFNHLRYCNIHSLFEVRQFSTMLTSYTTASLGLQNTPDIIKQTWLKR